MDVTWITEQVGVGGALWNEAGAMAAAREGVTHIINMQIEFDDRSLAEPYGMKVLWLPIDDDFLPKPARIFEEGVRFALEAMADPEAKVYIHCAAGVHRAPMMTLAVLRALGWKLEDAMETMQSLRPIVDFADVYVASVERWMGE